MAATTERPVRAFFNSVVMLMTMLFCVAVAHAEANNPLKAFPLSTVVQEQQNRMPEYRLVTGRISSIGAIARAEDERILAGDLTRVTYEIPRVHSPSEVMSFYRDQLTDLNARFLFQCEGRDCGRSNDWANEIFQERILYGHDRYQHYAAASFTEGEASYVAVIYTVRRGNQRIYAHVEVLQMSDPLALDDDDRRRYLMVAGDELGQTRSLDERLEPWLAEVKERFTNLELYIVSYRKVSGDSDAENFREAQDRGRILQLYVSRKGVPEAQVNLITVGPFASSSMFSENAEFMRIFATEGL